MIPHDHIQALIAASELRVYTLGHKTTALTCIHPSGFEVTVTSSASLRETYEESIGEIICRSKLEDSLRELETYKHS